MSILDPVSQDGMLLNPALINLNSGSQMTKSKPSLVKSKNWPI
jgi:hypothetical protein